MRLRVHDDGRWAVHVGDNDWHVFRPGDVSYGHIVGGLPSGFQDAVVLTPTDADADWLARAMNSITDGSRLSPFELRGGRAVLDRLAAGDRLPQIEGGQE